MIAIVMAEIETAIIKFIDCADSVCAHSDSVAQRVLDVQSVALMFTQQERLRIPSGLRQS